MIQWQKQKQNVKTDKGYFITQHYKCSVEGGIPIEYILVQLELSNF